MRLRAASRRSAPPDWQGPAARRGGWERDVLEKVLMASLRERRAARRWRIFFRFAGLALLVALFLLVFDFKGRWRHQHQRPAYGHGFAGRRDCRRHDGQRGIDQHGVAGRLRRHQCGRGHPQDQFPGGSPVQASIINDEIRRLRKLYPSKPLYVVVEEICASGGYYVAAAADKIYVDKASIVGSIGVLMDGFGFTGLMDKLGVERRLYTSGANKGMLDPFSPEVPRQKEYAQAMLKQIHQQFIDVVKAGRGDRLRRIGPVLRACSGPASAASSWGSRTGSAAPTTWPASCSRRRTSSTTRSRRTGRARCQAFRRRGW